jgi:hypothetical protein
MVAMKLNLRSYWISTAFASLVVFTAPLRAQSGIELAPFVGYYRPMGSFAPASVYCTCLPNKPSELSGLAWGVEARKWITHQLGVQVQASVINSTIAESNTPGGPRGPYQAQVAIVTAQALFAVSPSAENVRMWFSAGPALIRHGGEAYSIVGVGAPVTFGGALGAGLKIPLASRMSLAADVETILYSLDIKLPPELSLNPGKMESGSQADLLLHLGLSWNWR